MGNPTNQITPKKSSVSTLSAIIASLAIFVAIGAIVISLAHSITDALSSVETTLFIKDYISEHLTILVMLLVLPVCLFIAAFSEKSVFPRFLLVVTILLFLVQIGAAVLYLIMWICTYILGSDLSDLFSLLRWIPSSPFFARIASLLLFFSPHNLIRNLVYVLVDSIYLLETFLCVIASIVSALKKR